MSSTQPERKPARPYFSSGPCVKHPGWAAYQLEGAALHRSHRSVVGQDKIKELLQRLRQSLEVPPDHHIAMVPGSATGATEIALWSLLGPRGVDVWSWEFFGSLWAYDVIEQLKIPGAISHQATSFGGMPDFSQVRQDCDQVVTWCGTTSGAWLCDQDLSLLRGDGLLFCDATSAVFATPLPWDQLDVTAFSWQKGLGGEAAHGMLILSPRAFERLKSYRPSWPMPRLFRLFNDSGVNRGLFEGKTLNTPSLLCIEDCLNSLRWVESVGGLQACVARTTRNFQTLSAWVEATPWVDFVVSDPLHRARSSVCLKIIEPGFTALSTQEQRAFLKRMNQFLVEEQAVLDGMNHIHMPPSLRIWCGPTVEEEDVTWVGPWLDWAFARAQPFC